MSVYESVCVRVSVCVCAVVYLISCEKSAWEISILMLLVKRKLKYLEKQNNLSSNPRTVLYRTEVNVLYVLCCYAVLYVLYCTCCIVLYVLYSTVPYCTFRTARAAGDERSKFSSSPERCFPVLTARYSD